MRGFSGGGGFVDVSATPSGETFDDVVEAAGGLKDRQTVPSLAFQTGASETRLSLQHQKQKTGTLHLRAASALLAISLRLCRLTFLSDAFCERRRFFP
jgi:hypothetical protein